MADVWKRDELLIVELISQELKTKGFRLYVNKPNSWWKVLSPVPAPESWGSHTKMASSWEAKIQHVGKGEIKVLTVISIVVDGWTLGIESFNVADPEFGSKLTDMIHDSWQQHAKYFSLVNDDGMNGSVTQLAE